MYSEKVMDHFENPRNVGKIENPDGYGKVQPSIQCIKKRLFCPVV